MWKNRTNGLLLLIAIALMANFSYGQDSGDNGFGTEPSDGAYVDENCDGFNDNAPDADGDGIPNGQDSDYTRHSNDTSGEYGSGSEHCDGSQNSAAMSNGVRNRMNNHGMNQDGSHRGGMGHGGMNQGGFNQTGTDPDSMGSGDPGSDGNL